MKSRKLLENIVSLSTLQLANYLIPLVTVPYLVRTIGPQKFGLINFVTAFSCYFILIQDYGFGFSATRDISSAGHSQKEVARIFSSVIAVKVLLFVFCTLFYWLIVLAVPLFTIHLNFYSVIYLSIIAAMLTQFWFFQGMEEIKHFIQITLIVRFTVAILIFFFIKKKDDALLFLTLNSAGNLMIGLFSSAIILYKYKLRIITPTITDVIIQLKQGGILFSSSIAINLYTTTNIFLLGLFAPADIVGYYSGADKIRIAVQGLYVPVSQSIYPHLSKTFSGSFINGVNFLKKILLTGGASIFVICLILFYKADLVIQILLGPKYGPAVDILRIISFIPFFIFLSNISGIQLLLNCRMNREFIGVVFLGASLSLILNAILAPIILAKGTAISFLVTEMFITAGMFYHAVKKLREGSNVHSE